MNEFETRVGDELTTCDLSTLQINVGFKCNQACKHCHLECGPNRTEVMDWSTMEKILGVADAVRPGLVDITGGAPEINPHFRKFIDALSAAGHAVQVRSNLTIMTEAGFEDVPQLLSERRVGIVGSMPCYLEENVAAQRGIGVYEKSVEAIKRLNECGYGRDPSLTLNLVYNPGGPFLPPSQIELEQAYHKELKERFNIEFSHLLTITNMPLGRFERELETRHEEGVYLKLLMDSFNPKTVENLMCRHQVSIGWDGTLYDCDFNLALGLAVDHGAPDRLSDFDVSKLATRRIMTGKHCFGCTAGCGSSCKGALLP